MSKLRLAILLVLMTSLIYSCTHEPINVTSSPTLFDPEVPQGLPQLINPPDNPMTVEGIALGRKLFYDSILSKNEEQSCSSCHDQQFGFGTQDQFEVGVDGNIGNRNAMPIINLAWGRDFFWDGRAVSLEEQSYEPIVNPIEMNTTWPAVESKLNASQEYVTLFENAFNLTGDIDSTHVVKALAQFMRTLISGNSRYDKWRYGNEQLTPSELNGLTIFENEVADCFHCHQLGGGLTTDNDFHNNGMDTIFTDFGLFAKSGIESDKGKFKTPTLRNISVTAPYMHDGRFFSLRDVIDHYSEHIEENSPNLDPLMELVGNGGAQLSESDKDDLEAFLMTLTDDEFLTNSDFSNPNN
jgi:cytochrome c peroxidase